VFACARSAGEYDGSLRTIIHAFKYGRCRALAAPLGTLMREAGRDLLRDADAVVPVPLHPWRHFVRGFNQADDLARELKVPVWRVLRRPRHGPPQAVLSSGRRHANVARAFRARDLATIMAVPPSKRITRLFDGPTVVLVDDVLTTGATADACARALMHAGARTVRVLTAARAVAGRPARRPFLPDPSTARRQ
jgi:ComF family protein